MDAIRHGAAELKFSYSYRIVLPSAVTSQELADNLLGMACNHYKYGSKEQAIRLLERARDCAPTNTQPYYQKILWFTEQFKDREDTGRVLLLAHGSSEERQLAEAILTMLIADDAQPAQHGRREDPSQTYENRFLMQTRGSRSDPTRLDFIYGTKGRKPSPGAQHPPHGHIGIRPDANGDYHPAYVRNEFEQDITKQMGDTSDPD